MIGGFTNYAHLRLRDHRPGNGDYELPPEFGPQSGSSKRSILSRHCVSHGGESSSVGPGAYTLPDTIGTGRGARFASPLAEHITTTTEARRQPSTSLLPPPRNAPVVLETEPKQHSMALCPTTPSYSFYGRLKSEWELQSSNASPGPAAYGVPGYFDQLDPLQYASQVCSGVAPGVHLGMRTELLDPRVKDDVPGPGAYDLVRFGDVVAPRTRAPVVSLRRRRNQRGGPSGASNTPDPGAYDDLSSIGYRSNQTRAKRRFVKSSTFGGRWRGREYHTTGPGPAAYSTWMAAKLLEKDQRHAPRFVPSQQSLNRGNGAAGSQSTDSSAIGPVQPPTTLPSDFDFNYCKGKSILGKWHVPAQLVLPGPLAGSQAVDGPGFWESPLPQGGRFAAGPYVPSARQLAADAAKKDASREAAAARLLPGPGAYDVHSSLTERRAPASLFGCTSSAKYSSPDTGVPGPGHYCTVDDADHRGTVFYKGDFYPRGGYQRGSLNSGEDGGGPGAHYNDDTAYSGSINGDRVGNNGFTIGIRYPARATYQHCAPYDETTNINCVYPDELTWEVKPQLRLPPIKSAKE